jgi:copper oxidase (laccase) domain-containing protein
MARPPPTSVAKTHQNSPASLRISADTAPREQSAIEQFAALEATGLCRHAFIRRIPGINVEAEKPEVLSRLDATHAEARRKFGFDNFSFATAEQIHGDQLAIIDFPLSEDRCFGGADGLLTDQREVCLGVYVADCAAVYIVDPLKRCLGLIHSGKKGTGLGIVTAAIEQMHARFGSSPPDLIVQISPCIRPPHYEIDFAGEIVRQCKDSGVKEIHDSQVCTACDLTRYYSYRAEKARTGRMLALLALAKST